MQFATPTDRNHRIYELRLREMADYLEHKVKPAWFNLDHWVEMDDDRSLAEFYWSESDTPHTERERGYIPFDSIRPMKDRLAETFNNWGFRLRAFVGKNKEAQQMAEQWESCGTTACAIGWTPGAFPKMDGGSLIPADGSKWFISDNGTILGAQFNEEAVYSAFLGLTIREGNDMFMPGSYDDLPDDEVQPRDVAEKLRGYADGKLALRNKGIYTHRVIDRDFEWLEGGE